MAIVLLLLFAISHIAFGTVSISKADDGKSVKFSFSGSGPGHTTPITISLDGVGELKVQEEGKAAQTIYNLGFLDIRKKTADKLPGGQMKLIFGLKFQFTGQTKTTTLEELETGINAGGSVNIHTDTAGYLLNKNGYSITRKIRPTKGRHYEIEYAIY